MWNGSITTVAVGSSSLAAVLNLVNLSIATTTFTPSRHALGRGASHALNAALGWPSTMSSNLAGPVPARIGVRSMITVTYLSPRRVWRHTCSSTPTVVTPIEPGRVVDQDPSAFGQDGVVGGVPRHGQRLSDPGHAQVLHHNRNQRPPQRRPGQLRTRLSRPARVLTPHVTTTTTPVAAHGHQQRRRPPPERDMNQPPDDRVPRHPLTATPITPVVRIDHPTHQACLTGIDPLRHDLQSQLVQTCEPGQIRTDKGTV